MNASNTPLYFNERTLRNDLEGDLRGCVLFAQVSILPNRASRWPDDVQPRLVARRATLVMFRPETDNGPVPNSIELKVAREATWRFSVQMAPPEQLPPVAERDTDAEYGRIIYARDLWSAVLPGHLIIPGNVLEFDVDGRTGTYRDMDVGAPSELLLHTIDIGMLTPHRGRFIDHFGDEMVRQYFQTLPCSRLIVNRYEPIDFHTVELADGTVYRDHSAQKGEWHGGDLREKIGKQLVSLGINNANLGIHSSPGSGENGLNKHFVAAQFTAHTSVGNYINGRVVHGGSGGGSMVTLEAITGNEFSHELGHNYGLGHHPGGFAGAVHRSAVSINSAWGWDSDANVFIPNFRKNRSGEDTCYGDQCQAPFHGHSFGRDSMGDGAPYYPNTRQFTQYTPYSLETIQRFLEGMAVFSPTSSSGFRKWSEEAQAMVEWREEGEPDDDRNVTRKPDQQGVPVTTILGYYDPDGERSGIIYPSLHAAYGMTYEGDSDTDAIGSRCYAVVSGKSRAMLYFILRSKRLNPGELNRLHLNIPESFEPMHIAVYCDGIQNASGGIDPPKGTARVTIMP